MSLPTWLENALYLGAWYLAWRAFLYFVPLTHPWGELHWTHVFYAFLLVCATLISVFNRWLRNT